MGANNSVPRTVVLINPNPRIETHFSQKVFVRPETVKIANEILQQSCEDRNTPKEINAVYHEAESHQQETNVSQTVVQANQEKAEENQTDMLLPLPTIYEMCSDAIQSIPTPDDKQKGDAVLQESSPESIRRPEYNDQKSSASNLKIHRDGALQKSQKNATSPQQKDYDELLCAKSLEMEKYYFDRFTKNWENNIGKPTSWQQKYAKELEDMKKDLINCYKDNMGQALNCAKLSEEYRTFVGKKHLEFLMEQRNVESHDGDANAQPTKNDNNC